MTENIDIVSLGIKKLKKFGYSHVNRNNILYDDVYKIYFERILRERLRENAEEQEKIIGLLKRIKLNTPNN